MEVQERFKFEKYEKNVEKIVKTASKSYFTYYLKGQSKFSGSASNI